MESIGAFLKQEREKKNITIEQISRDTRISKGVLYAIESDSFEDLPGGFFNIGILRTYAKYIGIDENKIISEYKKRFETTTEKPFYEEITKENINLHFNKKTLLIIFIFIFFISVFIWFFHPAGISSREVVLIGKTLKYSSNDNIQIKEVNNFDKMQTKKKKNSSEMIKTGMEKKREKIKTLDIVLYFREQCWIEIKRKENIIISKLFLSGEKYSTTGDSFTIKLGNPSGVKFTINGEKGFINSTPGIPITFKLNLNNYKQYLKNE